MHAMTFLQSLKDAMIVTSCGAEALPLISAFGVLPASVAFIMYYDRLVRGLWQPAPAGGGSCSAGATSKVFPGMHDVLINCTQT